MSFISFEFIIFFLATVAVTSALSHRSQNRFLLVCSYVFYGWWDWRFLGLIVLSTLVDYGCGLAMDESRGPRSPRLRRRVAAGSVVTNLMILGVFKYYGFFVESARSLADSAGLPLHLGTLDILLPVGISFYTFQSMSYTLDIYRRRLPATRRLDDFALYVAFFPQLVAGPIERAGNLLPQIQAPRRMTRGAMTSGAQLMLVGFFKKMVVADNLAVYVDSVFDTGGDPSAAAGLLAMYAFAFQIYADFSGYTDIARGAARIMGFELRRNFEFPYLSRSPGEFWRRWHMSLSAWLRDYLYISLGGNRRGRLRTIRNLVITMLLGGLWHGASWNFVLWGAYHGLLLVAFRPFERRGDAPPGRLRDWWMVAGFFQLICFGWLIFRARDLQQLWGVVGSIAAWSNPLPFMWSSLLLVVSYAAPLFALDLVALRSRAEAPWEAWPVAGQVAFLLALFYGVVLLGSPHRAAFIYFQF